VSLFLFWHRISLIIWPDWASLIEDGDMLSLGDVSDLSPNASVMLKISILAAWAELQIASQRQAYLNEVIKPFRWLLGPFWVGSLRDYAGLRTDPDMGVGAMGMDNSVGREVLLPVSLVPQRICADTSSTSDLPRSCFTLWLFLYLQTMATRFPLSMAVLSLLRQLPRLLYLKVGSNPLQTSTSSMVCHSSSWSNRSGTLVHLHSLLSPCKQCSISSGHPLPVQPFSTAHSLTNSARWLIA
jgi:hypothetical protein